MRRSEPEKGRSRRRGNPPFETKERLGAGFIISMLLCAVLAGSVCFMLWFSIAKGKQTDSEKQAEIVIGSGETSGSEVLAAEKETEAPIKIRKMEIDGISIENMSETEAKNLLLDTYVWDMRVSYGELTENLENPLPEILEEQLTEIYNTSDSKGKESYTLDFSSLETGVREQVAGIAEKWNRKAVNAQLSGRDKETGKWIYSEGENGIQVDETAVVQEIMALIEERKFAATVEAKVQETAPEYSAAAMKEQYQVIGTFSTTATSNQNRNNNISLAMNALDGLVIFPGEEFSFNKTTGNRTKERGYMPAGAYRDGKLVEEPGGGVCQVSSTLYNAIVFSGIQTTERNPHSYEPSYVTPGEDAMVSYDGYSGPDLRFVNNQDTSVAIRAVFQDKKLTISIIGVPILEDGVTVSMRSEKVKEYDPPEPEYEEDQTLQPGQEVVVKEGVKGTVWKTWLVTSKDGKVISDDYFHSSTYRGKSGLVRRNTTGVTIPAETSGAVETETQRSENGSPQESQNQQAQESSAVQTEAPVQENTQGAEPSQAAPGDPENNPVIITPIEPRPESGQSEASAGPSAQLEVGPGAEPA